MVTSSRTKISSKKKNIKKKRRLKIGKILLFLLLVILFISLITGIFSKPITNIYISGNKYLSDQQIIEIARLQNYPSTITNLSMVIKKRLEKNELIKNAKVTKQKLSKIYIEIEENRPIFFNSNTSKTMLLDGTMIDKKLTSPTLVNYVPDVLYSNFVEVMKNVNEEVLMRTSEIIYNPNDVDTERFLFIMDDDNYVYLTLKKFSNINNYVNIVKKFGEKKGILYLDSGEYFQVLDN